MMVVKTVQSEIQIAENENITGQELFEMGDIGPCELIEGRIVRMSPTGMHHGVVEGNFYLVLRYFVDENDL